MVNRRDYSAAMVTSARSVLLELSRLLGEYDGHIVVVGGWVPELLIPDAKEKHVGSIDVDLALDHNALGDDGYRTIKEHLLSRGYVEGKQPFIFHRKVGDQGNEIEVQVDFLAGEYAGTGKSHRTQKAQDMKPRKARGVDLAFQAPRTVLVRDRLPDGGEDERRVWVASVPVFLVMKGMAIKNRLKEKDAWDVYYCIRNFPGGVESLVEEFQPLLEHGMVQEGLQNIAGKFSSVEAVGPTHIVNFEEIYDAEERARIQRDAFERVRDFLERLGM